MNCERTLPSSGELRLSQLSLAEYEAVTAIFHYYILSPWATKNPALAVRIASDVLAVLCAHV